MTTQELLDRDGPDSQTACVYPVHLYFGQCALEPRMVRARLVSKLIVKS